MTRILIHGIKNRSWDNFYDNGSHPNRFISNLINPLSPARCEWNLSTVIFERMWVIDGWSISGDIALRWMSPDLTDDKSTLVQVMAWCRQATSHYMNQCWPISVSSYAVTKPQRVNIKRRQHRQDIYIYTDLIHLFIQCLILQSISVNLPKLNQLHLFLAYRDRDLYVYRGTRLETWFLSQTDSVTYISWRLYYMETPSALLALCEANTSISHRASNRHH